MKILEKLRLELIDDASKAYKFASVRVSVVLSAIGAWIVADPHAVESVWLQIPADIRSDLPGWIRGLFTFLIVGSTLVASRLLKKAKPNDRTITVPADAAKPAATGDAG